MAKALDRTNQIAAILSTESYRCGDSFTAADISSVLAITASQARDLLNIMAHDHKVDKKLMPQKLGNKNGGTIVYSKPCTRILRDKWRIKRNSEIRLVNTNLLGSCGR